MPTPLYEAKADLFRALAHPVRVRVLELLLEGPRPVHELVVIVGVEPSNLSQQLAVLRRAGLVDAERGGGTVSYSLSTDYVAALMKSARGILTSVLTNREKLLEEIRLSEAAS